MSFSPFPNDPGLLTNYPSSATDALGRTGVLASPSDPAPAIAASVTVLDAPWHAKGDAKVVTDGAIGAASNQLSSANAAFTATDVGKVVVVQGAGPNVQPGAVGAAVPGVLTTTIQSVAGGVATLAANASATVAGATVKYGTDDTTAIQAAIAAMSTLASTLGASGTVGRVRLADGRAFMIGHLVAKSNVWVDMYGATLHLKTSNATTSNNTSMMFGTEADVSIGNFHLRGGTFPGTGTEGGTVGSQSIIYWQNDQLGNTGVPTYTDISVKDAVVTNWATACWDIRGCSRVRFSGNTCRTCSTFTGLNVINLAIGGGTNPDSADARIQDNFIDGAGAECIAIGQANTGNFDRIIITGNDVQAIGGATCIDVEWSTVETVGHARTVIIANNVCRNTAVGGSCNCINATPTNMPAQADVPDIMDRVLILGNICDSSDGGIVGGASDMIIAHNYVNAACASGILTGIAAKGNTTLAITADTNATTTLSNVVVGGSGTAINGMQLSGPNIADGTYLVSGAGTATWTISLAATGTATGNALTGYAQINRVLVLNNIIHQPASATNSAFWATGLRDSRIEGNVIAVDPGSTTATFAMLVQRCGWTDVLNNRVSYASQDGIRLQQSNDCNVKHNRIYNPSAKGAGLGSGIMLSALTGGTFRVESNICVDDRATHLMFVGVNGSNMNTLGELVNNVLRGTSTGSPAQTPVTIWALIRGNTTDNAQFPQNTAGVSAGASPWTSTALNYPCAMHVYGGGTVSNITINRTGATARQIAASVPATAVLAPGDTITVTWATTAPNVLTIPLS